MSISGGASNDLPEDTAEGFDDLYAQTLHGVYELDLSGQVAPDAVDAAATSRMGPFQLTKAEVLQGRLKRNQIAELVYVEQDGMLLYADNYYGESDPGSARFEAELVKEDTVGNAETPSDAFDRDNRTNNSPDGLDPDAQFRVSSQYDEVFHAPGRLMFDSAATHDTINDETNGLGSGGVIAVGDQSYMAFRDQFGRGPMFGPNDELRASGTLRWVDMDQVELAYQVRYRLYWDVFETPEQYQDVEGDLFG